MNYVITGGAGNTSKPLAERLLAAGHSVTVIGRNAANLQSLIDKGAKAAIGSVDDDAFLHQAFAGADAVYTMVPPNFAATEWKSYIAQVGKKFAEAIKANGIKHVVNLSSVGADLPEGCGPVTGLYHVENELNALDGVHVKHLRAGFFYLNFLASTEMIRHMNILGGNYGDADTLLPLVHTDDIAAAAAQALLQLDFTGHSVEYIVSDERTTGDVASVLGNSVGKPQLPWVAFSDEQTLDGMLQAGLPEEIAKNYVEMGASIRHGQMNKHYFDNRLKALQPTKLEDFAPVFASVYNQTAPEPATA